MNNIMDNIVVFIIIQTLIIATPMMITAVGACVCELTGVTNIGLEGIMLSGAFAAAVTNISLASVMGPYIGLLVGMFVGGIISCIRKYTFKRKSNSKWCCNKFICSRNNSISNKNNIQNSR